MASRRDPFRGGLDQAPLSGSTAHISGTERVRRERAEQGARPRARPIPRAAGRAARAGTPWEAEACTPVIPAHRRGRWTHGPVAHRRPLPSMWPTILPPRSSDDRPRCVWRTDPGDSRNAPGRSPGAPWSISWRFSRWCPPGGGQTRPLRAARLRPPMPDCRPGPPRGALSRSCRERPRLNSACRMEMS